MLEKEREWIKRENAENGGNRREREVQREKLRGTETTRKNERERETRDDRTRGTDVFETSCRYSHASTLNLYPHPLYPPQIPPPPSLPLSLVYFAHTTERFVIRANLIARRHRWPLTRIELSAVSLPVQGPPAAVRTLYVGGNGDIIEF